MAGDPNYDSVSLLLPFDGADNSTVFRDRSNSRKTITVAGNAKVSTVQSKFGGASLLLDGSGDYLSTPDHDDFSFGAGDFTIEAWVRPTTVAASTSTYNFIVAQDDTSGSRGWSININGDDAGKLVFGIRSGVTPYIVKSPVAMTAGVWAHVAAIRNGNTLSLYKDGVLQQSLDVTGVTFNNSSANVFVGAGNNSGSPISNGYFNGYIDDLRITKGIARYTSTFTPHTTPHPIGLETVVDPDYTSVSLLINADGSTIVDESSSPKTITAVGNAALTKVDSKVGAGSLVFDGTGDYLTVAASADFEFGTGDFTFECWYRPSALTAPTRGIASYGAPGATGWVIFVETTGAIGVSIEATSSVIYSAAGSIVAGTWYHLALVRASGVLALYKNGISLGTYNSPAISLDAAGYPLRVGLDRGGVGYADGYIDALRVTKGVARYTSTFTPPNYVLANHESYTITIGTYISVQDFVQLSIPTSISTYENYTITIGTSISVQDFVQLSIPTSISNFETYTIVVPTQVVVQDAVYPGSGAGFINGSAINGGSINGAGNGSAYLVTRLTIPTQIQIVDWFQLTLPTEITVISFPRRLTIPLAISNYQVLQLSIPLQINVVTPSFQLSIPLKVVMHEVYSLSITIRVQVYPGNYAGVGGQGVGSVVQLPTSRSQEWSLQVLMNGVDVSSRLVGKVSIDLEESSAAVAVFSLRLPSGIVDPYVWVKAPVEISYEDVSNGVTHLLYKGSVDTPAHNATSRITEFTCTDNLQNKVRAMTHAQIDALTPLSKWSRFVFNEEVDSWDYLQDRLATYPYAVHLDTNDQFQTYNFQASTIRYEFRDYVILDGSLSPSLANAREIVNQVNVSMDAQFDLFRETVAKISWKGEIVVRLFSGGPSAAVVWPCSAAMVVDAIQGAGATFSDDPLFGVQAGHRVTYGVNFLNPGTELLVESFQGLASKRFQQSVVNSRTYSIQNTSSIAQLGVSEANLTASVDVKHNDSLVELFNRTKTQDKWLCSAGTRLQVPRETSTSYQANDPTLLMSDGAGAGFVTYPLLPISYDVWDPDAILNLPSRAYTLEGGVRVDGLPIYGEVIYDFDDFVIDGTQPEQTLASDTLVEQAKVKVLSTHRQNRLGFSTFINPLLRRGQTLRVNTSTVVATGVTYQLQHTFDIDQGTALTNVTLALSSSKAIGSLEGVYSNIRLTIPLKIDVFDGTQNSSLPMDNSTIEYNQILLQYVGDDPEAFTYDNQNWGGFFTNYTTPKYQEFVVEWPDIPEVNTANTTVVSNGGIINVDVPNDEFYLIA